MRYPKAIKCLFAVYCFWLAQDDTTKQACAKVRLIHILPCTYVIS